MCVLAGLPGTCRVARVTVWIVGRRYVRGVFARCNFTVVAIFAGFAAGLGGRVRENAGFPGYRTVAGVAPGGGRKVSGTFAGSGLAVVAVRAGLAVDLNRAVIKSCRGPASIYVAYRTLAGGRNVSCRLACGGDFVMAGLTIRICWLVIEGGRGPGGCGVATVALFLRWDVLRSFSCRGRPMTVCTAACGGRHHGAVVHTGRNPCCG